MLHKCLSQVAIAFGLATLGLSAAGPPALVVDAARKGDVSLVRQLIEQKVDVNAPGPDGTTALHWAAELDVPDLVDLLLRAGGNAGAANRYGVMPISLAAANGNPTIIEKLLKAGADPNSTRPGGETALMTAARTGKPEAISVLLAHGADVNAAEPWKGQTALMWAAAENNAAAIKTLIEGGADTHAHSTGEGGFTALTFAARAGHIDALRALLAGGADVNEPAVTGHSGLVLAITSAKYDAAAFLLDNGADPNAAAQGWSSLHQIVYTRRASLGLNSPWPSSAGQQMDSAALVRKLVAQGADINARVTRELRPLFSGRNSLDRIGATPFLLAAQRLDLNLMRLFVELGADPLLPTEKGTTPLMAAAGVGLFAPGENPGSPEESFEAVKLCLELGGDPMTVDKNGDSAAHGPAWWGSVETLELLASLGAPLHLKNERGWSPLRISAGVHAQGSFKNQPEVAARLKQLLSAQGLPTDDGDGGVPSAEPPPGAH